jgi:hypothetical protein
MRWKMNTRGWSKRSLRFLGILLAIGLVAYLLWDGSNGMGSSDVATGIILMMILGALYYLQRTDIILERGITQRIRAEYPTESQPQVFGIYKHLKAKELEYLFVKILDDAKGDLSQVKKLSGLAESMGPQAFLENHW